MAGTQKIRTSLLAVTPLRRAEADSRRARSTSPSLFRTQNHPHAHSRTSCQLYRCRDRYRYVLYRVPLGSVEEWVIVNQRKGRGEWAEGCHRPSPPPPTTTTPAAAGSKGPIEGWGQRRSRRRRRGLGESRPCGGDVEEEGEAEAEAKEGGAEGRVACERAGPGEVTADGHPFHLHVNHFQVCTWHSENVERAREIKLAPSSSVCPASSGFG